MQVETPKLIEKDEEDRFTTWEFPKHNFTLMALWSQFLVSATKIVVNGTDTGNFDLYLDRVDPSWSEKLPSLDYAVFSGGHWFIRSNRLYEGGDLIGRIFSDSPNVTNFGPGFAVRKALRAVFKAVNECRNCKKIISILRTFSPPHFENGEWNTGGGCNRTGPIGRDEVDRARPDWEYRRIQLEEVEMARIGGNNDFEVVDVTEMMSVRVDGHPNSHWENRWKTSYRDCVHWCMPGPIDTWNELLLETIKRYKGYEIDTHRSFF